MDKVKQASALEGVNDMSQMGWNCNGMNDMIWLGAVLLGGFRDELQ